MRAALVLGLALAAAPLAAPAAETTRDEFRALVGCAIAMGAFEGAMKHDGWAGKTAADQALLDRAHVVEDALRRRTNGLAAILGGDKDPIIADERQVMVRVSQTAKPGQSAMRVVLDHYQPVLEACIVRGKTLGG